MPTYLEQYPVMNTRDPEHAREQLISVYGADGFDTRATDFGLQANYARLANSGLAFCFYDAAARVSFPEAGFVRQFFSIRGQARYRAGKSEAAIGAWTSVIGGNSPVELEFEQNYQQLVLRMDASKLEQTAKALLGDSSDRQLQFDDGAPLDPGAMALLRRHVFHLASELDVLTDAQSPLVLAEFERSVMIRFLLAHPHNFRAAFDGAQPRATISVVQRVEEFIEANWDRPIEVTELAAVANVSVRAIFREFARAGKGSPAQFAKTMRLRRAAAMLKRPEAETTVTGVALRCGFHNLGRFSADYFRAFGELPSETLRRSRAA